MGIGIKNKKDILLLLLFSPGCKGDFNEPITGRTRLVKMMFLFWKEYKSFFQKNVELTEDNFYKFFPWLYGPFSKEIYDDLMFFELRGYIVTEVDDTDILPEASEEWSEWSKFTSMESADDNYVEFEEQRFRISDDETKISFVKELYNVLTIEQRNSLQLFKCKYSKLRLRAILKYVYAEYPDWTTKSKILEQVMGN